MNTALCKSLQHFKTRPQSLIIHCYFICACIPVLPPCVSFFLYQRLQETVCRPCRPISQSAIPVHDTAPHIQVRCNNHMKRDISHGIPWRKQDFPEDDLLLPHFPRSECCHSRARHGNSPSAAMFAGSAESLEIQKAVNIHDTHHA